jgi:hypothetical protein
MSILEDGNAAIRNDTLGRKRTIHPTISWTGLASRCHQSMRQLELIRFVHSYCVSGPTFVKRLNSLVRRRPECETLESGSLLTEIRS